MTDHQSPKPFGYVLHGCFIEDESRMHPECRHYWAPVYSETTVRELEAKAPKWLPIDQAPTDSTVVDVWDAERCERLVNVRRVDMGDGNVFYESVSSGFTCIRGATHFMHIPAAPESGE